VGLATKYGELACLEWQVLSIIFSSSVPFTFVLFILLFNQVPSAKECLGSALIVLSVSIIGLSHLNHSLRSGSDQDTEKTKEYLIWAIVWGLASGLLVSLNLIHLHFQLSKV
jgi:drug/metabolite transporter (DMT)-like permease